VLERGEDEVGERKLALIKPKPVVMKGININCSFGLNQKNQKFKAV
jgi:hypothetical protein